MKALIISMLLIGIIMGQQVVELKQENSAKLIVKFMFKNGSVCDPQGKEGKRVPLVGCSVASPK